VKILRLCRLTFAPSAIHFAIAFGEVDPPRLGGTRCPQHVGKKIAASPPDICAFGDSFCHRSEPDWHFQEKPIHPDSPGPSGTVACTFKLS
jgi:hypothetical protein